MSTMNNRVGAEYIARLHARSIKRKALGEIVYTKMLLIERNVETLKLEDLSVKDARRLDEIEAACSETRAYLDEL